MSRFHNTFLGYRIYRKKFLGTVAVVVLLCSVVFFGMLFFFVEKWTGNMRIQVQNRFHDKEKRLELLQNWTDDYVNGMYEDAMVMQDLKALFEAATPMQYVQQRYPHLMLEVYQKNQPAIDFYRAQGFHIVDCAWQDETQLPTWIMSWPVVQTL